MTDANYKELRRELVELFSQAEKSLKKVEQLNNKVIIGPSLNELRYIAHHLVNILKLEDELGNDESENAEKLKKKIIVDYNEAIDNCKRSIYDSDEVGIMYLMDNITLFKYEYRYIPIGNSVQDYTGKLRKLKEIQNFIANTNKKNNRGEYHQNAEEYFDVLNNILNDLDLAREEMNKKARNYLITFGISIAALILAALKIIFK